VQPVEKSLLNFDPNTLAVHYYFGDLQPGSFPTSASGRQNRPENSRMVEAFVSRTDSMIDLPVESITATEIVA